MASTVLPNGIIVPEKFSRDWYADLYHNWQELDNLLGGGTPKDGTLTIQKNGDTVGTFSANQSTDETVNIEVPTKTSDLNNDSGYITGVSWNDVSDKPSFATVATSGSYTDLSNKPTISTVNDATLTIQQNGVTVDTFTANSSSDKTVNIQCVDLSSNQTIGGNKEFTGTTTAHDLVPSATDTYNFGSPSYQWNNAYIKSLTINGVACGDILTHNASEFIPRSGGAVLSGTLFTRNDTDKQIIFRAGPNYADGASIQLNGKNLTAGGGGRANLVANDGTNNAALIIMPSGIFMLNNGSYLRPSSNNSCMLGANTYRWSNCYTNAINGLNPGALSLPSNSSINVDTTDWDLTCQNGLMGSFTPTADGWLMLQINNSGTNEVNFWVIGGVLRINNKSTLNDIDNANFNMITIPVTKGSTYNIYGMASEYVAGRTIGYCEFTPCQGNV